MTTKRADEVFADALLATVKQAAPAEPPAPAPVAAPAPRPLTHRSVFSHPDAHPVVLDLVLLKHFQLDWLSWLSDTLFDEIEKTFNTSIAEVNRLKILAAQSLHVTDSFWEHWEVFEKTICALNGIIPQPEVMQPPDLPLLYAGVDMAAGVRTETFSGEIARYCAAVFLHENVHYAPEPLDFCQVYITQPMYECRDCGKVASMLPPFDGFCSSCVGTYRTSTPLKLEPDPELVHKGFGRNLANKITFDPTPAKKRLEELDRLAPKEVAAAIRETPADIQAAKLIIAADFQNYRAQQLKEQLESLRSWLEAS